MKLFVWDFHGVLEKDCEYALLEVSNKVLKQERYTEEFTLEQCRNLYGKKWHEFFKYLLPLESHKKHLELQDKAIKIQQANKYIVQKHIKPNDNVFEVLEEIEKKHTQIIISNTNPESMRFFLDSIKISKYFPDEKVLAVDFIKKKNFTKADALKTYLKGKEFDELIIIGDTEQDMELAKAVGGKSYLYAHPHKEFRVIESDYKINDLRELLKEA